jgi:hypothetical protein
MILKYYNSVLFYALATLLLSHYCLFSVTLTSSPLLHSKIYTGSSDNTRIPSQAKSLGFSSPVFDPSCHAKSSTILIDGGRECQGSQTGNYLASIYLSALRAKQRNNTFTFLCGNGSASIFEKLNFALPSNFRLPKNLTDLCVSCKSYAHVCKNGLNHAFSLIRRSLLNIRAPESLDDVTIHFRCGDILSLPFREYGYPRYKVYKKYLSYFNTLGILTAPISNKNSRLVDDANAEACNTLLADMLDYFSSEYPYAKVIARNNDSLEEAFGRLLYSEQSWCNPSTLWHALINQMYSNIRISLLNTKIITQQLLQIAGGMLCIHFDNCSCLKLC